MLTKSLLCLAVAALQVSSTTAAAICRKSANMQDLYTWDHVKSSINTDSPVAPDEVRRSRRYNVSVSLAGANNYQNSFVYETIPRNGNGKRFDPALPIGPKNEYNVSDGDGITLENEVGINMAWSQFEYGKDVDVKISSIDNSQLGPTDNVVIRPVSTKYNVSSSDPHSIIIRVPYDTHGRRFSVEFQDNLYTYRSGGVEYVREGGLIVSEEPKDGLLIFASPFIQKDLIPSKTSADTEVLKPGRIVDGTIGASPTLYFEAGVYWVEDSQGVLGNTHIKLDQNTHFVYFEPGTYIKGAFQYTTPNEKFYTIGHGVVSGENYVYMANTAKNYTAQKDDRTSLRIFFHESVTDDQAWTMTGPTLNAPPFNTVDLFPKNHTDHEEDNLVQSYISDYKQVGAYYFQTDGTQIYAGTLQDIFWHANDDAIKLYHSNAQVSNITVWKCRNDPIIQMGWKPRNVSGVTVDGLEIIHNRWPQSSTVVPSSIIGASPYYMDPKLISQNGTIAADIRNVNCEGRCTALLRIAPMNNYNLTIQNVNFDSLLNDPEIRLGESLVGTQISDSENAYVEGQDVLFMGIHIQDWQIGGQKVGSDNWQADQLGQLNINATYWGDWSIS